MKQLACKILFTALFLLTTFLSRSQPIAGFEIDSTSSFCSPSEINFTNTSTGIGPLSFVWEFGIDSITDTLANPIFVYDSCGFFTVVLTVTDSVGQIDADTQQLFIQCSPDAKFISSESDICFSGTVSFIDGSLPADSIASWLWDFGDPSSGIQNISTDQNPDHLFDSAGSFTVMLIATSQNGCSDTASGTINVYAPEALYTVVDSIVCMNDTIQFIDASISEDPIIIWSWNFGDSITTFQQNPVHSYNEPGEYVVRLTVTTEHNCISIVKSTITVLELPNVTTGPNLIVCPFDSVQLLAEGAETYLWQPSSLLSDSAIANPLAFPVVTTDFYVTGTDTNGCSATDTIKLIVVPSLEADAGNDTTICKGTSCTLLATGGISFQWTPSVNISNDTIADPVVTPDITTTYTVTVTNLAGCSSSDSVTVFVNLLPTPTITGLDSIYCQASPPVKLTAEPEGGVFSGDGISDNSLDPSLLLPGGPYSVNYIFEDTFGCIGSDTSFFSVLASPVVSISAPDTSLCFNASPIELLLSPPGGILTGAGINGITFDPVLTDSAGAYSIFYTFTDTTGCSNTDSLTMVILPLPDINAGNDTVICSGDTIQLNGSGGINYSWLPDSTLSNTEIPDPLVFPSATTSYVLTGMGINGCSDLDTIIVTVFSVANVDAGVDTALCKGDSIVLHAEGGGTFLWSPSASLNDSTISDPIAFPSETTTYTVSLNSGTSCPAFDTVTVTVFSLPVVFSSPDTTICSGDTVQLIASGALIYSWAPDTTLNDNQIFDPLAFPQSITTYIVTGTDSNGCSSTDNTLITVLALPEINAGVDSAVCLGDTIQLSSTGGVSYSWIPSSSLSNDSIHNPLAFPDTATLYIVSGADTFGCINKDSVLIQVLSADLADAGNDTSICIGDSVTLHASGGATYHWAPDVDLSDPNSADPLAFPQVTTTYTVVISIGSICEFADSVTVTVNDLPVINAGQDTSVCPGDSVQLFATGGITYQWTPTSFLSNSQIADPFAFPALSTQYSVTGIDANGCTNIDSIFIDVLSAPNAFAGNDTAICVGDSIQLNATGGALYEWSPTTGLSNPNIANPIAFPQGTIDYIIKVTDGGNCAGYDTINIIVNPLPDVGVSNDTTVCEGSSIQLSATGGVNYQWSPAQGLTSTTLSNPVATINGNITYSVIVTDINNCSASDSVHISLVPLLDASVSADTTICEGSSVELVAVGGTLYSWTPQSGLNDPSIANPIAEPDTSIIYSVVVADGICYSETLQVSVSVSSPTIDAGEDVSISPGESFQLNAQGSSGTYQWDPSEGLSCNNCLNPLVTTSQTTEYAITVTDAFGCTASDEIILTVGCGDDLIFVPNAFTPNNNGKNDVLLVRSPGTLHLNFFRVFDRWGTVIFESNDMNSGWDGTYKNKLMSPGVYLYLLEAECSSGDVIRKQGNVTLLR